MKIEIEDLKKVKLNEGDVLFVTFDEETLTEEGLESTVDALKDSFPRNRLLFTPRSIGISVITKVIEPTELSPAQEKFLKDLAKELLKDAK